MNGNSAFTIMFVNVKREKRLNGKKNCSDKKIKHENVFMTVLYVLQIVPDVGMYSTFETYACETKQRRT